MRRFLFFVMLLCFFGSICFSQETGVDLPDFDKLWNYSDPAGTEAVFRELLPKAKAAKDTSYYVQLLTQIARTQGLQGKFEEAHSTLDSTLLFLKSKFKKGTVRYMLERGRVYNSAGETIKAKEFFLNAWNYAKEAGDDFYALDAAHMMGIVEPPDKQLEWSLKALEIAENSKDPKTRAWMGALYNNIGWTYHDLGKYDTALTYFQDALEWRIEKKSIPEIRIAKWCVGRTLRSLNRIEEALEIQEELEAEFKESGEEPSGYVNEELGELYLLKGKEKKAKGYFKTAYEMLSQDPWLEENEADRLERLKELGGLEKD